MCVIYLYSYILYICIYTHVLKYIPAIPHAALPHVIGAEAPLLLDDAVILFHLYMYVRRGRESGVVG